MEKKETEIVRDYRAIREDYMPTPCDPVMDEPGRAEIVKRIIQERLNPVDRTIILLYIDCGSYRKLGARMGFSHMTMRSEVLRIRQIILDEYRKITEQK